VCGDSQYGGYEQCDDGNATSGDGCSSLCQLEPHYACDYLGAPCTPVVCGDGQQQSYVLADGSYAYESCDDGNAASGDGCTAACNVESGWICEQAGAPCRQPVCGDGKQDSWFVPGPGPDAGAGGGSNGGTYYYEECDDGNSASSDGCTSTCTLEAGWICSQPGEACREPVCGDGFVDFIADSGGSNSGGTGSGGSGGGFGGGSTSGSYEACDDGNTQPGDGCNSACSVEAGWNCDSWLGACHRTVCGDGLTDYPAEECDDGNTTSNDGCAHDCTWENQGGFGGGSFGGAPSGGAPSGGFGATG
jgi:cysteine-rich repeat protein